LSYLEEHVTEDGLLELHGMDGVHCVPFFLHDMSANKLTQPATTTIITASRRESPPNATPSSPQSCAPVQTWSSPRLCQTRMPVASI
jgi:hypothetical protein